MVKAEEALHLGLVNYVVELSELLPKCQEIAQKILQNSPLAISAAIKAVNAGFTDGENGYQTEIEQFSLCFGTADFKEGTSAFLEKRKANFRS